MVSNFKRTFIFHNDPGHAWLQVETSMIKALNVTGISSFSYIDGAAGLIAFLEEDCDAGLFLNAYKEKWPDTEIKFDEVYLNVDHWIRELPSFQEVRQ